jgi:hypothetical protein
VLVAVYAALAIDNGSRERDQSFSPLVSPPSRGGQVVSVIAASETGVEGVVTASRGAGNNDRFGSVSLSSRRIGVVYDRGLSVRVNNAVELGGSARGFHGEGVADISGGYRFHVTDTQGPFIRGGIRGIIGGDALLYQSMIELPQAQLGYQYLVGKETLLEVAERTGFSVFGRSDASGLGGVRPLDQVVDVGALATVKTGPLHLSADWSHFIERDRGSDVNWLTVTLCGAAHRIAVCTEARAVVGDVHLGSLETTGSRVMQVGLTVGFAGTQ